MSSVPASPPPVPGKRPYGTVRLTAAVPAVSTARKAVAAPCGQWHGLRAAIPVLSFRSLRGG
ncbi:MULTISPECIES: hypothetical protein [Streptomycetaceae]|uniref:hypothetical protein n=1 Tax=Streptomycetaceae TaxID=2062 RepID=UPI0005A0243E|nr:MULTISPECIES: hypothetical protein [Streptomycetaceae]MYS58101.1 hypothetical protein [Streptomyces sp. SID5468]